MAVSYTHLDVYKRQLLIQIGGLGVITVGAAFALLSGRKISLKQRSTMQEATAARCV